MTETINNETIEKWNEYVESVSCPFIKQDDLQLTESGNSRTMSKPLLDSGWNFYVQKKEDYDAYGVKITGNGTYVSLYTVATLEDVNLLFENISQVVMMLKKTYGYDKLKDVFEYFKEDKKYAITPKNYSALSDDGKIKVIVRAKGADGFLPVVVDNLKGTDEIKEHNSICSACVTFDEARLKCEEVLDMYNTDGCYVRDIKYRKFELEHECIPTVRKQKTHTLEVTDEELELLRGILDRRD